MLKTLPTTSHHLTVCEANFIRLGKLLNNYLSDEKIYESINPNQSSLKINFLVLDKTKHTIILEAKQTGDKKNIHSNFILRIQVSLDAKLAEVLSYQGEKPLPFFMNQSKRQSSDEKLQQNKFLTEWLESIFISGISNKEQINNILKNV
ncbi:DUF1249 domain-containing protein [Gammaproteobacteria bacterium]|jgi:uncharacterized protein YqiB (DUF1249 family)|nr:DUF1249 domain-containing protein [Gammaproteobacteria bacterium]MDC1150197.1 DUF1249 domain-containing protein [Gammaproteobacteria bacterium]